MRERGPDRGSFLALVPAAVLVLVILGAIAVDSAIAFLGQREVSNAAAAAANDAAGAALSDDAFYRSGLLVVDEARARSVAAHAVAARAPRRVEVESVDVAVAGDEVCVTVRGRVPYVFSRALPFVDHEARVVGQAAALAVADGRTAASPGNACR